MLTMTSAVPVLKTTSVLHLVLPKLVTAPEVQHVMNSIKADSTQILKLGETILTDDRFNYFETIVLHGSHTVFEMLEILRCLRRFKYDLRLEEAINHPRKRVIVLKSSIRLLPEKINVLHQNKVGLDTIHGNIDVSAVKGLGWLNFNIDIDFDPTLNKSIYARNLGAFSMREPIYLMDTDVVYSDQDSIRHGNIYLMSQGKLKKVTELKRDKEPGVNRIPSIRALYDPQSTSDKSEAEEAKVKVIEHQKDK